ncbi:MAG: phosphohistidine phosphatase SixA [Thermodesulfovibrio sp. RBG_19FT_COMBO_42_12]|nr:MAG: phosphohistidine phosphatase SixA [Thermodesulfovibrio sp. RBG_19FT_COMBO_42_12]
MKLYLMQHGRSVTKEEDPERPLTGQGVGEVIKIAEFLGKIGVTVSRVLHSGKTRAKQTAEIIISRLNPGEDPVEQKGLSPMDDVKDCFDQINGLEHDIMIIGHLPHLNRLISLLIAGSESISVVAFQHGGVVCLSRNNELHWSISWMVAPEII